MARSLLAAGAGVAGFVVLLFAGRHAWANASLSGGLFVSGLSLLAMQKSTARPRPTPVALPRRQRAAVCLLLLPIYSLLAWACLESLYPGRFGWYVDGQPRPAIPRLIAPTAAVCLAAAQTLHFRNTRRAARPPAPQRES